MLLILWLVLLSGWLVPVTLALAFLLISQILVVFVSEYLIINVFLLSPFHADLLSNSVTLLKDVDIAILGVEHVLVANNLLSSHLLNNSLLMINLLLPRLDLHAIVEMNHFGIFFPRHFLLLG